MKLAIGHSARRRHGRIGRDVSSLEPLDKCLQNEGIFRRRDEQPSTDAITFLEIYKLRDMMTKGPTNNVGTKAK